MIRPEKLTEQFILTDDELEALDVANAASLNARQQARERVAAALEELIEAACATQDDFTLTEGGPK